MSMKKSKFICKWPRCRKEKANKKAFCHKHHHANQKEKNPISYTFSLLKSNATRRGKEFTITLKYFTNWCNETGYISTKGKTKNAMTIDRDNHELGYVPGNLKMMTNNENRKKYVSYLQQKKALAEANLERDEDDIVYGDLTKEYPF